MEERHPIRIGFIFEGPTDEATIPVLVGQLLQRPIHIIPLKKLSFGWSDFKRPIPRDLRAGRRGSKWGTFQSYIQALLIEGAEVIIVVADHDNDEDIGQATPLPHKRWCILGQHLPFEIRSDLRLVDRSLSEAASGRAQVCSDCHLGPDCFPQCISEHYQAGTLPVVIGIARQMLEAWLLAQPEIVESVLWEALTEDERARCVMPEAIAHPKNEIIRRHNGGSDLSQSQADEIGRHRTFNAAAIEARCPSFARFAEDVRVLVVMP